MRNTVAVDERLYELAMSWTLIDSATERDALLELYAKDAVFMIRANGLELMNGFCHDSEVELGSSGVRIEFWLGNTTASAATASSPAPTPRSRQE